MRNKRTRTGSDQRGPDGLARLLPVPADRELPAGRAATLKEHLMSELRPAGPRSAGPHQSPRRRRPALRAAIAAAGALAAAAAAAAGVTVLALPGPRPAGHPAAHGHPPAGQITAAQLLGKIADAAARQPAPAVRDSQYVYISSKVQFSQCDGGTGRCTLEKPHRRQIWLPVADLCRPGLLREPGNGMPNMQLNDNGGRSCPNPGGMGDPTYRFLQSLPTNPRALLKMIYAATQGQGTSADEEAFTTIGDLLRESVAPPRISAALYRAAALIPGVTVVPDAVDAIGRPGIAVAFSDYYPAGPTSGPQPSASPTGPASGIREEWIFSRTTLRWLGERDINLPSGTVNGVSAVLQRGIVDHLGQLPPGH